MVRTKANQVTSQFSFYEDFRLNVIIRQSLTKFVVKQVKKVLVYYHGKRDSRWLFQLQKL